MDTPVEVGVLIPCLNEEANVREIHAAVREQLQRHATSWEIVFIDNGSTDATRAVMRQLCAEDRQTRAIFNTRNFGQMRSPTYGLFQTAGAAVIGMSADFQDPPELIGPLIEAWRGGAKIVLGQPRAVPAARLATAISRAGYWFLARYGDYPVIPRVTGFGLFDRAVLEALRSWREPEPFFRGMLVESGYPVALIAFDKPARQAGRTKNNFATLLDFALSSLAGSTRRLLRVPMFIALAAGAASLAFGAAAVPVLFASRIGAVALAGLAVMFGLFAILMLFLGVLGEQVRQIAERSREVPLVLEAERIGFPEERQRPWSAG